MPKKYKIATLGCRTNQYESLAYQNQLNKAGYVQAKEDEEADLCIVNTCTVTHSADSHSRHQIRKLKRQNPHARIAVTGCMVEKAKGQLLEIEEADFVISNHEKEKLLSKVYPEEEFPEFVLERISSQTRAFVKIQDGCNSFCSYCIIPYVRGRSKSRSLNDIVKEVKDLVKNGIQEVVLTGINIGDFDGADPKGNTRLCHVVQAIQNIEGLKRIRISSIDPDEVDEELIETLKNCPIAAKSMHIVLQSGSNLVLKKMNRKYTRQMFYETIDRLKPLGFTFTTDIIVGFPGESDKDFQETLEVVQNVQFAKVHMFPYSKRQRTKAALFPNQVEDHIKAQRKNELLRWSEKVAFDLRERYLGQTVDILTEALEDGQATGYTEHFLKVYLPGDATPSNRMIRVKLLKNEPFGFIGERVL